VAPAGDDQNLRDPGMHEGPQRVVNHRRVVDGQQMFIRDFRQRIQPRTCSACQDHTLHVSSLLADERPDLLLTPSVLGAPAPALAGEIISSVYRRYYHAGGLEVRNSPLRSALESQAIFRGFSGAGRGCVAMARHTTNHAALAGTRKLKSTKLWQSNPTTPTAAPI